MLKIAITKSLYETVPAYEKTGRFCVPTLFKTLVQVTKKNGTLKSNFTTPHIYTELSDVVFISQLHKFYKLYRIIRYTNDSSLKHIIYFIFYGLHLPESGHIKTKFSYPNVRHCTLFSLHESISTKRLGSTPHDMFSETQSRVCV